MPEQQPDSKRRDRAVIRGGAVRDFDEAGALPAENPPW